MNPVRQTTTKKMLRIGNISIRNITPAPQENGLMEYQVEYQRMPGPIGKALKAPSGLWGFFDRKTIAAFIIGMAIVMIILKT